MFPEAMAVLHVCLCGKFHYGRGRCRDCRKRATHPHYVEQQQGGGIDARAWTRIRRIVLAREARCLHCGAPDDLIVQPLPGLRHSPNPADYTTFCRGCDERAARRAA